MENFDKIKLLGIYAVLLDAKHVKQDEYGQMITKSILTEEDAEIIRVKAMNLVNEMP